MPGSGLYFLKLTFCGGQIGRCAGEGQRPVQTGAEGGEALLWAPGRHAEDGAGCSTGKLTPPNKREGSSGCGAGGKEPGGI